MTEPPIDQAMIEAFVDGELAPEASARLEARARADAVVAARIERARALRAAVAQAYDDPAADVPPERLLAVIAGGRDAAVIDLAKARAVRRGAAPAVRWGAIAASIVAAFFAGRLVLPPLAQPSPIASGPGGALVAQGVLASGLNHQLASNQAPGAPVRIGVTFRDQAGEYCRTFILRERTDLGGLACRTAGSWRIEATQAIVAPAAAGAYRTAGEETPPAVLEAMDQMIAGEPLDAAGERAARNAGWRPAATR